MRTTRSTCFSLLVFTFFLALAACELPMNVSGFRPVYPKLTSSVFGPRIGGVPQPDWTEVDTLRPTLKWEPVPGEHVVLGWLMEKRPFITEEFERIRNVRYDVKIWRFDEDRMEARPVHERRSINGTSYQLEESLEPASHYFWSVRARFEFDGKTRVSEWSLSLFPAPPGYNPREVARKTGRIPLWNYYRFKTPP